MSDYSYYPSGGRLNTDGVSRQAAAQPRAPALITEDRVVTWAEFHARVDERARVLTGLGVLGGERVGAALEPSPLAAETLFATQRLGATLALLPVDAPGVHLEMMREQLGDIPLLTRGELERATPATSYRPKEPADSDPALIVFTSGTEGAPRGVLLTNGNLRASARGTARAMRLLPGDRWLACLPFNHIAGPSIFMRAAEVGFPVVTLPTFDAGTVIDTISRENITAVSLVPTMLARMLEMGWGGSPSLRLVLLGGGPCSPPLLNAAIERRIPVAPTYGLTEASSQITVLLPAEARGHFGTVGRPLSGVHVRIGEHADAPAPAGTPGRIWLSGPMIARDSLDGPLLEGAWLGTNDMGRLDASGYLTILGRLDDVIITGGEKVIPSEVEAEITDDPLVGEVAVMGVPDAEWGQRVVAIVTPREPGKTPDIEALRSMLKRKLVPHKVPKQIRVIDHLPRTPMGKLDRAALRELAAHDD